MYTWARTCSFIISPYKHDKDLENKVLRHAKQRDNSLFYLPSLIKAEHAEPALG